MGLCVPRFLLEEHIVHHYGPGSPWGPGFQHPRKKQEVTSLKTGNTGYLWGLNAEEPTIVGPAHKWHFRATPGQSFPFWALYNNSKDIGLAIYPTHEAHNWPDLLNRMLEGLNKEEGKSNDPL